MTLITKPRSFHRTMIIVCEDTHTAPNYLSHLKKQAIDAECWDYIEIFPKPPIETAIENNNENTHKTNRTKKKFANIEEGDWIEINIESKNLEQPVIYVRTAQKALQEEAYSIGWAVYDLDGHPGHKRAAIMAETNPNVNIAFSSRSIEIWFLLHFEQSKRIFPKVHCKTEKGKELYCNSNNQCIDVDCLMGYIRRNTPLTNYAKNIDLSPNIAPYIRKAITNSEWLRTQYYVESPFYTRNPYTTVDKLVKSLLKWVSIGDKIEVDGFLIEFKSSTSKVVEFEMNNISKGRQIIQKNHFAFEKNEIEFEIEGNGIVEVNEVRPVKLTSSTRAGYSMLKYPASNEQNYIWILC